MQRSPSALSDRPTNAPYPPPAPPHAQAHSRRATLRGLTASALTAGWAATGFTHVPRARAREFGPGAQPVRYPDPDLIVLDPRFHRYRLGNTPIQRLHTGTLWAEGPAWHRTGQFLVWSDIPNDLQLRWLGDDGHVSVLRRPSGYSNGNTFDLHGRQISCEHGNRRVVRHEPDGTTTVLADRFDGKPLNAPNDVVVHARDGAIWFTDPGYGALLHYEGNKAPLEIKEAVYRIDADTGRVEKVTDELWKPNGLCFSPDYRKLYVADTGASHYSKAKNVIKVWDVVDERRLENGRTFADMTYKGKSGPPDGLRTDIDGNLWVGTGWVGPGYDGVHVFAPDGKRIGIIQLPETASNLCFGGRKRNRLFITASQSLYAVYVETQGAHFC